MADKGHAIGRRALFTGGWRKPPPPRAVVRPPGAVAMFTALCDGCGECAEACPAAAIVMTGPATDKGEDSPEIIALAAPCVMCDDLVCTTSCPVGALAAIVPETMRIAHVSYNSAACWARLGLDPDCNYCFDRCPLKGSAITYEQGRGPEINAAVCTGCGVCVHYCPSQPKSLAAQPL